MNQTLHQRLYRASTLPRFVYDRERGEMLRYDERQYRSQKKGNHFALWPSDMLSDHCEWLPRFRPWRKRLNHQ